MQVSEDPVAVAAFESASRTLVEWWDADGWRQRDRNFGAESELSKLLQHFLMQGTPASALRVLRPVLDAIDRHPREIHAIVQGLTSIEDSMPNTEHYWYLWGLFADGVKHANWVARLNDEHQIGSEMLSAIFLAAWWNDNVRHWRMSGGSLQ